MGRRTSNGDFDHDDDFSDDRLREVSVASFLEEIVLCTVKHYSVSLVLEFLNDDQPFPFFEPILD